MWIALGAIVPLVAVVSVYAFKFHARLADEQSHWAEFGEYVGGTLGGIYGLLAFLGVLYSIHVQRQQAAAGQLQTLLDSAAKAIDNTLNVRPPQLTQLHHLQEQKEGRRFTVERVLSATAARDLTKGLFAGAAREEFREKEVKSIRNELFLLDAQFLHFSHCLIEFRKAGGSQGVEDVYRVRYNGLVLMLAEVGHLNAVTRADFDVEALRRRQQEALAEDARRPTGI
jgi:hypothetical protein